MTNEANDIIKQAKHGSVAAVIQVLNEKLADSGVRTRAIFADGVLQLLCEAPTLEQLEQPILVERIRYLLEDISPRNIRRVNINSRIVREQQLLWLEEIHRDPENQLLWSEEITLKKPNLLKQLQANWASSTSDPAKSELARAMPPKLSPRKQKEQRHFWRGLAGGVVASCLLLAAGWWAYTRFGPGLSGVPQAASLNESPQSPQAQASAGGQIPSAPQQAMVTAGDPFVDAVRLAEKTVREGQNAKTAAEWLSLAAQWQKASDLMAQVEAGDSRYKTAQNRVGAYRQQSEVALDKARQLQGAELPAGAPEDSTRQL